MSWFRAAPLAQGPGEEGDVFDEEADESVLVHREWRSHMQRRVKVKLRGGGGRPLLYRVVREAHGVVKRRGPERKGPSGPGPARRCPPYPLIMQCCPRPARVSQWVT